MKLSIQDIIQNDLRSVNRFRGKKTKKKVYLIEIRTIQKYLNIRVIFLSHSTQKKHLLQNPKPYDVNVAQSIHANNPSNGSLTRL